MSRDEIAGRGDPRSVMRPVALRLQSPTPLTPASVARIEALGSRVEAVAPRSILQDESSPMRRPRYLLHGWACRFRHLPDGRRQIFDLVLPGEGLGICLRPHPLSQAGVTALTSVRLVDAAALLDAEALDASPDLLRALQAQADLGERRLLDQIVRLGRLTAIERLAHFFVDLHERLDAVGLVGGEQFEFPLTQEVLADVAGLSVVHVNRTLQELRRQRLVDVARGHARLPDLQALQQAAQIEAAEPGRRTA